MDHDKIKLMDKNWKETAKTAINLAILPNVQCVFTGTVFLDAQRICVETILSTEVGWISSRCEPSQCKPSVLNAPIFV